MKTFITLTLLFLTATNALAEEAVQVSLKASLDTPTSPVLLRDIIDPEGTDIGFIRSYGSVIVCNEQDLCDSIDQTRIFTALFQAGAPVATVQFRMSGPVRIEQGQKIDVSVELQTKIASAIATSYHVPVGDIRVEQASILPHLTNNFTDYVVRTITVRDLGHLAKSRLSVTLENKDGNRSEHTLFAKIAVETTVITATSALALGETLNSEHYLAGRQRLTSLKESLLSENDLKGKTFKLTEDVRAEQMLTAKSVRVSEIIKEGTVVTLSYNRGFLSIKTQGKLQAASEIGGLVQVENVESKQVVTGRLVTRDRVEVASAK